MTRDRLTLREYASLDAIPLTVSQVTAIQALSPAPLTLVPSRQVPETFDLYSSSFVGIIKADNLEIQLTPKLSISRLLFLISYAMNPRDWHKIAVTFEQRSSLLEAIIPGFVFQVRQALRRGVLQGYRVEEDALLTVRGRIRFAEQIQRRHGLAPPVELRFDEFTEDVTENRLLKAAIHRLTKLQIRSESVRQSLREFDLALQHVSLVEYSPRQLPEVTYTRLNERYRPAVELAKLILRATSFDLGSGSVAASAFLLDMNVVFERFVTRALDESLKRSGIRIVSQDKRLYLDESRRINLVPDISCWDLGRCTFVGDVKYKRTEGNRGTNPDLYQLLAYSVAADLPGGTLIYAKGEEEPTTHTVVHAGKQLRVIALDLEVPPDAILAQIDRIAYRIREQRVAARGRRHSQPIIVG
jgi:5-methylcytosine-specific restriction enzyme subunit McrC